MHTRPFQPIIGWLSGQRPTGISEAYVAVFSGLQLAEEITGVPPVFVVHAAACQPDSRSEYSAGCAGN